MKRILAMLLAAMMLLSLAACGGGSGDKTPSDSEDSTPSSHQTGQNTPHEGKGEPNNQTAKSYDWPTDEIPAWSGNGTIKKIEDLSSYTKDYTLYCIIDIDSATLDELATYLSEVKAAGFTYHSLEGEEPETIYKEDEFCYSWNGYTADKKKQVQVRLDKDDSKLEIAMWIV